jgi:serine/threonine-protein phosphatase 2B catalytic subunit
MLRGNHECRQLTAFFNFKSECAYKYDLEVYDAIMNSFDQLPLAAMINKSFFCVHGGLSPELSTLAEVRRLDRRMEIPREGAMCDLLWADPYEEEDSAGDVASQWFQYNDTRQCSWVFGLEAVKQFLEENRITAIIRAHEAQVDGYKMHMVNRSTNIPRVMTIFSAPNYADLYKNKAACLKFDHNILNIKQFVETSHPYILPGFISLFTWSLPFVAEKVTDLLAHVLAWDPPEPGTDVVEDRKNVVEARGGMLKQKVMAVTKVLRMYRVLRQESESIVQLKQLTNNKIPTGLLSQGADGIKGLLSSFESAKTADKELERHPNTSGEAKPEPMKFRKDEVESVQ